MNAEELKEMQNNIEKVFDEGSVKIQKMWLKIIRDEIQELKDNSLEIITLLLNTLSMVARNNLGNERASWTTYFPVEERCKIKDHINDASSVLKPIRDWEL